MLRLFNLLKVWLISQCKIMSITESDIMDINHDAFSGNTHNHKHAQKLIYTFWFSD